MTIKFKHITVHCSASTPSGSVQTAADIDRMHRALPPRGNGWSKIGYHFVIRRDGQVEHGRALTEVGAHVGGYNKDNLGICMIGGVDGPKLVPANNFTTEQFRSLLDQLKELRKAYPTARILGHRDWPSVAKACPSFDVRAFCKANGIDPF